MTQEQKRLSKIREIYDANEEINGHAENCCLLAEHFGTDAEKFVCDANLKFRDKFGFANSGLSNQAYLETSKYLSQIGFYSREF